jgi:hypothetical protein
MVVQNSEELREALNTIEMRIEKRTSDIGK